MCWNTARRGKGNYPTRAVCVVVTFPVSVFGEVCAAFCYKVVLISLYITFTLPFILIPSLTLPINQCLNVFDIPIPSLIT
ncbi:hypothetical protein QBC46DRAFT_374913 [Diplogelasinospora grovesii]|uniref:Uncharacterized protein n=1 Tax=Diplogelasinospora grovesii TaxID=303347 RepID=A0AAN6NEF9_9PEZI|nr:hypothetical protein QBC46DRAFT_374913 [Diplogelasinospora grovesii]